MTETVIYSTLFLTLLLMVGLFFFIRAATKDRTETLVLPVTGSAEATLENLTTYLQSRAYQIQAVDAEGGALTMQGQVRPSWFLAGFLTLLAGIGLLCFALVLASLFPGWGAAWLAFPLLAPAAGWFYWQRAGRLEQVRVELRPEATDPLAQPKSTGTEALVVTAHRDELMALQQAWSSGLATASSPSPGSGGP